MAARATTTATLAAPESDELVDAIIRVCRAMIAIAAESLDESASDVTLPQYRTLVVLSAQGPQRLADLAAALAVSPSTATRMCDRLVRKGLIDRTRDLIDRREVNLALTASGHALVQEVIDRRRVKVQSLLEAIPRDQRSGLRRYLTLLADTAGQSPEPNWSTGWPQ
jgi:DNA-binding MarR family transcriptional regulator